MPNERAATCAAAILAMLTVQVAWADNAPAARTAAKKASAVAADGAGYTLAAAPAWVKPLSADGALQVTPAALQLLIADEQVRIGSGPTTHYQHFVRQVNETSGLQRAGLIEFEFDPSYQKLVLHRIDILRDGKRIHKLNAHAIKLLHRETQLERQMIDGRMTASVVLDDLRVGDRIEWDASYVGDNPAFGGRFSAGIWSPASDGPTGLMQYRLLAPTARTINVRALDPLLQVTTGIQGAERETLLRRTNVPQFTADPTLPPGEYLKNIADLSEFADWAAVAGWSQELFAQAMRPTPALDELATRLQATAATPEAQVRAALDFVQRDIRYFGTEIGPGTHRPADVDTVLRQRFGDCKDKASLLAALLTRMGFDAAPMLVSTGFGKATRLRLPTPLAFDHVIVRVVLDGQPMFLDATRDQQLGTLASRQSRDLGVGLIARTASTDLTQLPDTRDVLLTEFSTTFSFPHLAEEGNAGLGDGAARRRRRVDPARRWPNPRPRTSTEGDDRGPAALGPASPGPGRSRSRTARRTTASAS